MRWWSDRPTSLLALLALIYGKVFTVARRTTAVDVTAAFGGSRLLPAGLESPRSADRPFLASKVRPSPGGMCPSCHPKMAAPSDFTARVMARIDIQSAPPCETTPASTVNSITDRVRIVGGVVGFSALVVLVSSFSLTLLSPSFAFTLLGILFSVSVSVAALVRVLWETLYGAATNDGFMLMVTAFVTSGLLLWSQLARHSARVAREA